MEPAPHASLATFTVDPRYLQRTARWFAAIGALAVVILVLAIVLVATTDVNAFAVLLPAILIAAVAAVWLVTGRQTRGTTYALTVGPDQLMITWRDLVTAVPTAAVDHAVVSANGPWYRGVDVLLRPGAAVPLPPNARPRPSQLNPGYVELFIVALLQEQEPACLDALARVIDLRR